MGCGGAKKGAKAGPKMMSKSLYTAIELGPGMPFWCVAAEPIAYHQLLWPTDPSNSVGPVERSMPCSPTSVKTTDSEHQAAPGQNGHQAERRLRRVRVEVELRNAREKVKNDVEGAVHPSGCSSTRR